MKARAGEEISEFDNDLRAQLLEIQMAVEQIRTEPLAYANPEPRDIGLTIPQDIFERQEQMLESQFSELEPVGFDYGAEMEGKSAETETEGEKNKIIRLRLRVPSCARHMLC